MSRRKGRRFGDGRDKLLGEWFKSRVRKRAKRRAGEKAGRRAARKGRR